MASSFGSPQHYIECDNCEENPAKYICKTCPGHLCENCKTEHENRKITKDHEVTDFKTGNKDFDCYLFCPDHKAKKLECFCDSCKKPVCTECIVLFHNGHAVQSISAAYKEIRDEQVRQITQIEEELRNCKDVLEREEQKDLDLAKKADEIEKQIMKHTSNVVEMVNEISKRNVQELRVMEQIGRNEVNKSVDVIRRNVQKLTQTKEKLSANIETKPGVSFFQKQNSGLLAKVKEDMEEPFSNLTKYELDDFQPGKICDILPTCFGTLPDLRKIPPPRPPPPPQSPPPPAQQSRSLDDLYLNNRMINVSSPRQQHTQPQLLKLRWEQQPSYPSSQMGPQPTNPSSQMQQQLSFTTPQSQQPQLRWEQQPSYLSSQMEPRPAIVSLNMQQQQSFTTPQPRRTRRVLHNSDIYKTLN